MKKNYEKAIEVFLIVGIVFVLEIVLLFYLSNVKVLEYKVYSIILLEGNDALLVVPENEKSIWYKNAYIYWNNKKIKYQIKEIVKEKNNYQFIIEFPHPEKTKKQDIITISIEEKRSSILHILKNTWGGDNNR